MDIRQLGPDQYLASTDKFAVLIYNESGWLLAWPDPDKERVETRPIPDSGNARFEDVEAWAREVLTELEFEKAVRRVRKRKERTSFPNLNPEDDYEAHSHHPEYGAQIH
ncbi:hypothetical protein [Streptomyces sp. NPDC048419]|uniref:hypothetical protein n=1 Tax=Streptomyces sp. NPDC048419 TaxID=3365547 RepID=UPI0037182E3E